MLPESTRATIDRFNEAFNSHDADALARVLTDDTVFEDTSPPHRRRRPRGRPLDLPQGAKRTAVAPPGRGRLHRARRQGRGEACLCEGLAGLDHPVGDSPWSPSRNGRGVCRLSAERDVAGLRGSGTVPRTRASHARHRMRRGPQRHSACRAGMACARARHLAPHAARLRELNRPAPGSLPTRRAPVIYEAVCRRLGQ